MEKSGMQSGWVLIGGRMWWKSGPWLREKTQREGWRSGDTGQGIKQGLGHWDNKWVRALQCTWFANSLLFIERRRIDVVFLLQLYLAV